MPANDHRHPVVIVRNWVTNNYPDVVYVAGITAHGRLLNEIDTVVKVELKE